MLQYFYFMLFSFVKGRVDFGFVFKYLIVLRFSYISGALNIHSQYVYHFVSSLIVHAQFYYRLIVESKLK